MKTKDISQIVDQLVYEAIVTGKESVDWCPEFIKLRKDNRSANSIHRSMNTLVLHNQKISNLDLKFSKKFKGIKTLSLSGNLLQNIESLPSSLEVLHLNANKFTNVPKKLSSIANILHLGLAYNYIQVLTSTTAIQSLVSLDLSHNQLHNMDDTITELKKIPKLKSLSLLGNPICLLKSYPAAILNSLPQLRYFDDCKAAPMLEILPVESTSMVNLNIKISKLIVSLNPGCTADDTGYTVSVCLKALPTDTITTGTKNWGPEGIQFDSSQSISFQILPTSINIIKMGLDITISCQKYAVEKKKPVSPKGGKAEKDKAARKKSVKECDIAGNNLI